MSAQFRRCVARALLRTGAVPLCEWIPAVPRDRKRAPGSVLLPTLFVILFVAMLLSAVLTLIVSNYNLARADRDRSAAMVAAEAGLNWELARIDSRLWDRDDAGSLSVDGGGNALLDNWPDPTTAPPATASVKVLATDGSGQWTQRFLVGTSINPYSAPWGGTFTITAEGQARGPDGHILKRRVKLGGATLASLFDSTAVFAFSGGAPAWTMDTGCSVTGACGSHGQIAGAGTAAISGGPIWLWGPNASISGVTTTGVTQIHPPGSFACETVDEAANLLRTGTLTGAGVAGWAPTGYNPLTGTSLGPADKYGRKVNDNADVVNAATDVFIKLFKARSFLDSLGYPILDGSKLSAGQKLRLKPGVYYFARINLLSTDQIQIANDYYKADGVTPLWDANHNPINGPATAADYDSDANRVTIFVNAITVAPPNPYLDSTVNSGLRSALQGAQSAGNPLRYRRPGNFRIYAKNAGSFTISGNSVTPVELSGNVLRLSGSPGSYYGSVTLNSSCRLYGGIVAWTVDISGSSTVQSTGKGLCTGSDPVIAAASNGTLGGFGGWGWHEVPLQ